MQFKPEDKVKAFGCTGVIQSISANGMFLQVKFPEVESLVVFHLDGRLMTWHKKPSLKLVKTRGGGL